MSQLPLEDPQGAQELAPAQPRSLCSRPTWLELFQPPHPTLSLLISQRSRARLNANFSEEVGALQILANLAAPPPFSFFRPSNSLERLFSATLEAARAIMELAQQEQATAAQGGPPTVRPPLTDTAFLTTHAKPCQASTS